MTDFLYVSYDKDEKRNEIGICIGRINEKGEHEILKMELDEQAEVLYKVLTDQSIKIDKLKEQ